jgi:S-adenosylmethionine-diacylglycerol 3-amino-3-carboxypropyl transferase
VTTSIENRARFDLIRYANCWEDADVLCEALGDRTGRHGRVLSIASGGDNSFALAAEGAQVVAVDLSQAQLAVVELKRTALLAFEHDVALQFFGLAPCPDRWTLYKHVRPRLGPTVAGFWDERRALIDGGFALGGKFEAYFRMFRRRVLPLVHRRGTIQALLTSRDHDARLQFYDRVWNNRRWQWLFRLFFSRRVMGRLGRDPEFFRYVQGPVAERILERCRHALTQLDPSVNPYITFILTGGFGRALPRYLQPHRFAAVREGLPRITLFGGTAEQAASAHAGGGFTGFNLSNIFEYLDATTAARVYGDLVAQARPGARLVYWNLLVPRRRPDMLASRVQDDPRAAQLHAADRAFFYSALVIEEVLA